MRDKVFRSNSRLLQESTQRANCKFRMQWNDTARDSIRSSALKHNVTPALPNLDEAQSFESADRLCP